MESPKAKNILEVKNLTKRFGELVAVKNMHFEVAEGEIFGIAGPNGSGKTTIFNLIAGVYSGSGGIIFDGKDIHGLRPFQICHRGVARTFQVPVHFSTMTVYQNIGVGAYFGVVKGSNYKERVNKMIDFVGLRGKEDILTERVDLLDKKLTMLAAALATDPKLLLIDEPIAGLSPIETRDLVTLLRKINIELGITIVIIEHFMKVLVEICHKLMIINNGEKVCIDLPQIVTRDKKVIEVYLGVEYA